MILKVSNIEKSFKDKKVLKGIDFEFQKGKIYGLIGRNGAGKTTLFNLISNEMQSDRGKFCLMQNDIEKPIDNYDIGYVYSTPVLPEFLTGYEFIKFFMDINSSRIKHPLKIDDYFDFIKFDKDDRHRLIKGYSHGMKNKIQMLCFIILRPLIILLDEPLTSFDVVVALEIKKLLKNIAHDHIIIFSTHILQLAMDLCDEIVILSEGKLEEIDHKDLKDKNFENSIIEKLKENKDHKDA